MLLPRIEKVDIGQARCHRAWQLQAVSRYWQGFPKLSSSAVVPLPSSQGASNALPSWPVMQRALSYASRSAMMTVQIRALQGTRTDKSPLYTHTRRRNYAKHSSPCRWLFDWETASLESGVLAPPEALSAVTSLVQLCALLISPPNLLADETLKLLSKHMRVPVGCSHGTLDESRSTMVIRMLPVNYLCI